MGQRIKIRQQASFGLHDVSKFWGHAGTSHIVVNYGYGHLYWIFRFAKSPESIIHCQDCGESSPVDKGDQKRLFAENGGNPIPAFDRYGAAVLVALVALGISYVFMSQADRAVDGTIDRAGTLDAFSIRAGDCYNRSQSTSADGINEVSTVDAVPCADPHDNEVYAVFDVSGDEYPGSEGMFDLAVAECVARFDDFVGIAYPDSLLDVDPLYPTQEGWASMGDREVICSVFHMEDEKLEGTARGIGI